MKKFMSWFIVVIIACLVLWFALSHYRADFLMQAVMILLMAFGMCLFRVTLGPTAADRAIAVDAIGILVVGFCGLMGIFTGKDWYIDIAIAWALQSFIGTLALAKYLEGRSFDE